jgi:hypothetical protein
LRRRPSSHADLGRRDLAASRSKGRLEAPDELVVPPHLNTFVAAHQGGPIQRLFV